MRLLCVLRHTRDAERATPQLRCNTAVVGSESEKLDGLSRRFLVSSLAATTTVGYGVLFYAYGVLLLPMEAELGWSRSVLTGAFTCALVVNALLTIPVGRWLDRHQPRRC